MADRSEPMTEEEWERLRLLVDRSSYSDGQALFVGRVLIECGRARASEAALRAELDQTERDGYEKLATAMERVGVIADRADNFVHASRLPLSKVVHSTNLAAGMETLRDELRKIVVETTGASPWERE